MDHKLFPHTYHYASIVLFGHLFDVSSLCAMPNDKHNAQIPVSISLPTSYCLLLFTTLLRYIQGLCEVIKFSS